MALTKCNECGKEISDTIKVCPHCGYKNHWVKIINCPECGKEISDDIGACPNCGYVVNKLKKLSIQAGVKKESLDLSLIIKNKLVIVGVILIIVIYQVLFAVSSIRITQSKVNIRVNDSVVMDSKVEPNRVLIKKVFWKSSDKKIAECTNGCIKAKSPGDCVVTAKAINGKKTKCKVHVMNQKEAYQNAVETLISYVDDNHDMYEDGTALVKIRDVTSVAQFYIGKTNDKLSLYYRDDEGTMDRMSFVMFDKSDCESAKIVQKNDSSMLSSTTKATGMISINDYRLGDKVQLDDIDSSLSKYDGIQVGVTDEFQKITDKGVKICVSEFAKFLNEHDELNLSIEDFGFSLEDSEV